MYTIKRLSVILFIALFAGTIFAQDDQPNFDKEFEKVLSDMSDEQKKNILVHAVRIADLDFDKEMERLLGNMSENEKDRLLKFASTYKKFRSPNQLRKSATEEKKEVKEKEEAQPAVKKEAPPATPKKQSKIAEVKLPPSGPVTTIEFAKSEFDFGTILQGEKVSYVYTFTNTGEEPLIIDKAKGSCGCTVPYWPKEPIAPGEQGEIKVEFNSGHKKGMQMKRVTITANTNPPQTMLTIKGTVAVPEED
jgi:hypothetical protein